MQLAMYKTCLLKLRETWFIQMKQIFVRLQNDKVLHLESHLSPILFRRSNCYLATSHKFCVMPVTNYWMYTFSDSQCNDDTLEVVRNFRRSIKIIHSFRFYCLCLISVIANCMCSSTTLHVTVALNSQYMFVVGAKPFPANQTVKYECFHCDFQIVHILPVVYVLLYL